MINYPALCETVSEHRLSNGLLMRVVPKTGFAKKYAFLAVDYGSIDTEFSVNGKTYRSAQGIAHYLEHKMFDMPDCNVMQMFSSYGGNPNAFTSYDITAYYVECTDHFEENLELLLRYVSTGYFTQESVEKERGIIAQEIKMYEDSPDSRVSENLFAAMYKHHPVKNSIAGTVESINEITSQMLYDCYNAFYAPENMMLCVVGDVDPNYVKEAAERILPIEKIERTVCRNYGIAEEMLPVNHRVEYEMEVSMPMFSIGFKADPAPYGKESMEQEIVGELAAEILMGESSELYTELYEKQLIDSGFSCGYDGLKGMSMLTASGDSVDPNAVLEAILERASDISKNGIDEALFSRLKKSSLGRRMRELDSFESVCYRMCAYHFEGVDYFAFPEIFRDISSKKILEFLDQTVCRSRACISVINPKDRKV